MSINSELKHVFNDSEFKELDKIATNYNNYNNKYNSNYPPNFRYFSTQGEMTDTIDNEDYSQARIKTTRSKKLYGKKDQMIMDDTSDSLDNRRKSVTFEDDVISKNSFIKNMDKNRGAQLVTRKRDEDYSIYDHSHSCNDIDSISYDSVDNMMEHIKKCRQCKKNFKNQFNKKHRSNIPEEHFTIREDPSIVPQKNNNMEKSTYNYDITPYVNDFKEILLVLLLGIIVIIILATVYGCIYS